MENIVESIGEKISRSRNAKGWSQEKLSDEADVNRRTVQNIEGGKVESPGIDVVVRLARALDISIGYLIDDKPTRSETILNIQALLLTLTENQLEHVLDAIEQIRAVDPNTFDMAETQKKSK